MFIDLKSAVERHRIAVVTLINLLPEAMSPADRATIKSKFHREVIGCALAVRFPYLPAWVASMAASGEGAAGIDEIETRLGELRLVDPGLFEPIPSREEMLQLAIRHRGGYVSDDQRRSLWVSDCDIDEERRLATAYQFRTEIAARTNDTRHGKPTPRPAVHTSPKIDGGELSNGNDSYELPGKIDGAPVPEASE